MAYERARGGIRALAVWAGLFGVAVHAAQGADDNKDDVQTTVYKRKVKTIGESAHGGIVRNPKGHLQPNHPYSERSFSNPDSREKSSSEMRRRFDEAFGAKPVETPLPPVTNAPGKVEQALDQLPAAAAKP